MNALRNLEAMLLREHESRMCSTRGSALPKPRPDFSDANEAKDLLASGRHAAVMALYAEGLSAKDIAARLRLSLRQVQRAARP